MPNLFAILGQPVSLTLNLADAEAAWNERTREERPDLPASAESPAATDPAELHRARAVLTDPVERLSHWLECNEVPAKRDATIAPDLMDLFAELSGALQETDGIIERHRKSTSAIARATLARDAVAAQVRLQNCMQRVQQLKNPILESFEKLEADAASGSFEAALGALAQLRFLRKWEQQCQDRLLALLSF